MRIIAAPHGMDLDKSQYLTVPAGTIMIFNTNIWHSATLFTGKAGQRYSVTRIYGRDEHLFTFIGTLSAREREIFRFPPAGHEYYTAETLAALEEQYPGWNARGEYGL